MPLADSIFVFLFRMSPRCGRRTWSRGSIAGYGSTAEVPGRRRSQSRQRFARALVHGRPLLFAEFRLRIGDRTRCNQWAGGGGAVQRKGSLLRQAVAQRL